MIATPKLSPLLFFGSACRIIWNKQLVYNTGNLTRIYCNGTEHNSKNLSLKSEYLKNITSLF